MDIESMYIRRIAKISKMMTEIQEPNCCYFSEAEKYRQMVFCSDELEMVVKAIGEIVDTSYSTVGVAGHVDTKGYERCIGLRI